MLARPVFVTRKFPPSVGGMETLAAGVWRGLEAASPEAVLIAHGGRNRSLVWWLPAALGRVLLTVARNRAGFVLCGDALTYAFLEPFMGLFRVPHGTLVMGLDVTFDNRLYQAVMRRALRRAPLVVAISEATAAATRNAGVPAERVAVLRLGVRVPEMVASDRLASRERVAQVLRLAPDAVILVMLGRLVRRKGARWFVEEVMTSLPTTVHLVIAGDGDEADPLRRAVDRLALGDRVRLLGTVDDELREDLLRGADLFVQPNIRVRGDMEGFGLVTIEAAVRGAPVVASSLEGIRDAVLDGVTGVLLPSEDAAEWIARVRALVSDVDDLAKLGEQFRGAAAQRYGEDAMGRALVDLLERAHP